MQAESSLTVTLGDKQHAVVIPKHLGFAMARELSYAVAAEWHSPRGWAAILGLCVPSCGAGHVRQPPTNSLHIYGGAVWEALASAGASDEEIQAAGRAILPAIHERARFGIVKTDKEAVEANENFSRPSAAATSEPR
jgi:hypothetical protein